MLLPYRMPFSRHGNTHTILPTLELILETEELDSDRTPMEFVCFPVFIIQERLALRKEGEVVEIQLWDQLTNDTWES